MVWTPLFTQRGRLTRILFTQIYFTPQLKPTLGKQVKFVGRFGPNRFALLGRKMGRPFLVTLQSLLVPSQSFALSMAKPGKKPFPQSPVAQWVSLARPMEVVTLPPHPNVTLWYLPRSSALRVYVGAVRRYSR